MKRSIGIFVRKMNFVKTCGYVTSKILGRVHYPKYHTRLTRARLNLTFTVASVTTNVSALLVGSLLDRYGPRMCGFCASFFLFVGTLCMAFGELLPFDAYMAGHFLLALGGTFIFVPSFHLSNAFPKLQGLVLALITGAFDASAAVFLVFRILYNSTCGSFGVRAFFLIYLVVPALILISQIWIMPSQSYETKIELAKEEVEIKDPTFILHDSDDELENDNEIWRVRSLRQDERKKIAAEIKDLLGSKKERRLQEKKEDEIREASGVWGALHGLPALQQMRTPWFILLCLLTVVQMARMNWFIATIWSEYRYILDSPTLASTVNNFFDLALPLGGILTVPFIGLLLDNSSTAFVLGLLVFITSAIGVFGILPFLWAAYVNCSLFVIYRPLYYSAMSDYAAKVFGFSTFGTVYGAIICISGLATLSAQSALQALTHTAFADDPSPVNLLLASLGLFLGTLLVAFVTIGGRKVRREHAEEDERRSLLPRPSFSNLRAVAEQSDESESSTLRPKPSFGNLAPVVESEESSTWDAGGREDPAALNGHGRAHHSHGHYHDRAHSKLNYSTFADGTQDEEENEDNEIDTVPRRLELD